MKRFYQVLQVQPRTQRPAYTVRKLSLSHYWVGGLGTGDVLHSANCEVTFEGTVFSDSLFVLRVFLSFLFAIQTTPYIQSPLSRLPEVCAAMSCWQFACFRLCCARKNGSIPDATRKDERDSGSNCRTLAQCGTERSWEEASAHKRVVCCEHAVAHAQLRMQIQLDRLLSRIKQKQVATPPTAPMNC